MLIIHAAAQPSHDWAARDSHDLTAAFDEFYRNPRSGEVYNMGGSWHANCSVLEAIALCEEIADKKLRFTYKDENCSGDHIWYISDVSKFQRPYPTWRYQYDLRGILGEIYRGQIERSGGTHTAVGPSTIVRCS